MARKANSYIEEDLDWLQTRVQEIKMKIEQNPYNDIEDRKVMLMGPKGMYEKVVATAEQQEKAQREAYKDCILLLEAIDKLREREEEKKKEIRGGQDLTPFEKGLK